MIMLLAKKNDYDWNQEQVVSTFIFKKVKVLSGPWNLSLDCVCIYDYTFPFNCKTI